MNSPLNLTKYSLITLICKNNDIRVDLDNNMDILFSFNQIFKLKKSSSDSHIKVE